MRETSYIASLGTHFALGKDGEIVKIQDVDSANRYANGPFSCIHCGNEMIPHLGKKRSHHFKHKGVRTPFCCDETYLHALAKTTVYKAISEALETGAAYQIEYERPILCERFKNEFGHTCNAATEKLSWDLTKYYSEVALEKSYGGFVPDVLLVNAERDDVLFLEIRVTHECEEAKKNSGFRVIEVTVDDLHDVKRLETSISLLCPKTNNHGLKKVTPVKRHCTKDCSAKGDAFAVFRSGKSIAKTDNFARLKHMKRHPSTVFFRYLGRERLHFGCDFLSLYLELSVEAQFSEKIDVRSCLLCRRGGLGVYDKPIFCFETRQETEINTAATCRHYAKVASGDEAFRRYKKNLAYVESRGFGQIGLVSETWLTEDDLDVFEH